MPQVTAPTTNRILSIDILRGIVMVVMALDHTRDFFSGYKFEPTDLQHASTAMFFTRWITHFCAPVFIFLSGTSAFLSLGRRGTKQQAAMRLLTRGLWLIVLEVTFVRFGWAFNVDYRLVFLQVIWAIGISMIALSGLIFLPMQAIAAIGLVMIFGHNLLDHVQLQSVPVLWQLLHVQGPVTYGQGNTIMIIYPLIPWIGVMATGYCFGLIFRYPEQQRNRQLYLIGGSAIVLFILLRSINNYGDPSPWQAGDNIWRTILSFVNCTKYPPSLLYLLMTLGIAITLLPMLEKLKGPMSRFFLVFGRVPLFYYVLHLYVIHGTAIIAGYLLKGDGAASVFSHPGYTLVSVYLFWIFVIGVLYLPCRWFMRIKQTHKQWWLSYL